ncbi:MAG: PKD domain-containing protein, partial [Actinobacteria bacterium]|nr:PKD domain-containing protein [Actinomycetota bacterium]
VGSSDPNPGDTFTYLWNFGDGTPTSTASANGHTFPADGTYTVSLIVTDGWGKAASTSLAVTIGEPPGNAAPTPVISNPICAARSCSFSGLGSSDPNGDSMTFLWNWGDGTATSTASTPTHAFAADGTYTVTLTTTDAWGDAASTTRDVTITKPAGNLPPVPVIAPPACVKKLCTLSAAGSSDPNGDGYTYLWNFGDATPTSTSAAPSHTFPTAGTFTVTLTLTDGWGDAASTTLPVTITEPADNVAPVPVINNPSCTARTCTFSAVGTADPNGDAFTYSWNFGDGSAASTLATPTKTYTADNTYTVTLTATDEWGRAASATRSLTIAEPVGNTAPTPVITAPTCAARTCVFSGISPTDAQGDVITFLWSFGDGSATSTLPSPTKTYAADGTYTVTLTTTDAWGDAASTTFVLTITEPVGNVAPTPVIGTPSCAGLVCVLSGLGSSDPNGDPFTYSWNFGDGSAVSTLPVPTKTYALAGTYTVTLTVTDGWGKAASTTRVVTVP